MAKYYHAVHVSMVEKIMREGLDPAYCERVEEEPMPFVFLAYSAASAAQFGPGGCYHDNVDVKQCAVLEVDVPADVEARFVFDLGEYVRVPFLIAPKYLTQLR